MKILINIVQPRSELSEMAFVLPVLFVLLAFSSSRPALSQDVAEREIVAAIDSFHNALAAGDSLTALSHLADDAVILESGGVENKEHYRTGHLAADIRYARAVSRVRGPIQIQQMGNVAWAYSTSITEGVFGEREVNSSGAELMVLVRDGMDWKIKAIHWSSRQRR